MAKAFYGMASSRGGYQRIVRCMERGKKMANEEGMNSTAQKIEKAFLVQQRMIEYLAKKAWKHGFGESLPDAKYCRKLNDEASDFVCWKCWIDEAFDKVVNNADRK